LYWQILEFRMHWKIRPQLTFLQASWSESLVSFLLFIKYYYLFKYYYYFSQCLCFPVSIFGLSYPVSLSLACRVYFRVFLCQKFVDVCSLVSVSHVGVFPCVVRECVTCNM
jgi:hypothetical protein